MEHRVKTPILDKSEISDSISFPLQKNILEIEISIDIEHTYRGDLSIYLKLPSQNEIILLNRTGGGADNFIRTFRSTDEPELFRDLLNSSPVGDWILRITDNAKGDEGILKKWGIAITY